MVGGLVGHLAPIAAGVALLEGSLAGCVLEVSFVRALALAFEAKQEAAMAALRAEILQLSKRRRVRFSALEVFELEGVG